MSSLIRFYDFLRKQKNEDTPAGKLSVVFENGELPVVGMNIHSWPSKWTDPNNQKWSRYDWYFNVSDYLQEKHPELKNVFQDLWKSITRVKLPDERESINYETKAGKELYKKELKKLYTEEYVKDHGEAEELKSEFGYPLAWSEYNAHPDYVDPERRYKKNSLETRVLGFENIIKSDYCKEVYYGNRVHFPGCSMRIKLPKKKRIKESFEDFMRIVLKSNLNKIGRKNWLLSEENGWEVFNALKEKYKV